jgi:hypothetical protein
VPHCSIHVDGMQLERGGRGLHGRRDSSRGRLRGRWLVMRSRDARGPGVANESEGARHVFAPKSVWEEL